MSAGMTYVAMSRATTLEGVILHPMQTYERYQSIAKKVVNQLIEIRQLLLMSQGIARQKSPVIIRAVEPKLQKKCKPADEYTIGRSVKPNRDEVKRDAETSQCSGKSKNY